MSKFKKGDKVTVVPWEEAKKTKYYNTKFDKTCQIPRHFWPRGVHEVIGESDSTAYSNQDYELSSGWHIPSKLLQPVKKEE